MCVSELAQRERDVAVHGIVGWGGGVEQARDHVRVLLAVMGVGGAELCVCVAVRGIGQAARARAQ